MCTEVSKSKEQLQNIAVGFGSSPLLVHPDGTTIDLETGYIPLLVNFTHEDKAAKGLRKRSADDEAKPPVYYSALEVVRDHKVLLLSGVSGSGKTTFAKHLCFGLATGRFKQAQLLARNDVGAVYEEVWDATNVVPCYVEVKSLDQLRDAVDFLVPNIMKLLMLGKKEEVSGLVVMLDTKFHPPGKEVSELLTCLVDRITEAEHARIVILGDKKASQSWRLPSHVARFDVLPLLEVQRRQAVSHLRGLEERQVRIASGRAAKLPAIFALSVEAEVDGYETEDILHLWLSKHAPRKEEASMLAEKAFNHFRRGSPSTASGDLPFLARSKAVQQLLAARNLAQGSPETAISLYRESPQIWGQVILNLLVHLGPCPQGETIINGLIKESTLISQAGALLVANTGVSVSADIQARVKNIMLDIIQQAELSSAERRDAGRVLSRLEDPRDLEELAEVEAMTLTFGSDSHPNSRPIGLVGLENYRIGLYPVVNRDYLRFVEETGRHWRSLDGRNEETRNVPATDLTWHDARVYCSWVTQRWRKAGKIKRDEHVRLPTEVEWEGACRGELKRPDDGDPVWPWGSAWRSNAANFEETGFNEPCTVGLFPSGRSPYGCYDMAGQVWEWCSTLWGEDMSAPSFQYPYQLQDGREDLEAPENIRRVLRGGCFSSGRLKVSSSYRGSLEPSGFWRGNGFRVVVARDKD
ncbi:hypothetical protein HBI56_226350 [Parastagonospora nodorum]|uniref:Sulfatase-modifying factor enzyme domain-containing protein n=1 Tax=Phaeosphaeria nodorum (strain SN15 / ATCC MYA-4574 / FGSC 10173) TaxID=321614 RepID=A0A7U2EZI4_PHANO|nr:hypothetical protein HBH56_227440 [Parastagonospora nodorum]QRC95751.1 hypothetical protein JI435_159030 [Parastagonospora nodorum SN15]KAH3921746.1 hypothetical protein HBH54_235360 [Parastagonospora nodorum]KAH3939550.1 hypothetical protein HBH53_233200 [Parastagonospora nodorum]KAH3959099.1 hypothetical protein HBH51_203250 [Parastagonospora nodorum]